MLNNKSDSIYYDLLNADPKDILGFIDYDDCLEPSTVRNLTSEQKQILWDLNALTEGGFIITTNSDGRSVIKEMSKMGGYPVISEFSTVFRNVKGVNFEIVNQPKYFSKQPDVKSAFNAATEKAKSFGIKIVTNGEDLAKHQSIKLEEKEQGIAVVFGLHSEFIDAATDIVEYAFQQAGISSETHEIDYKGKDAREIKVKGAAKADVIDRLKSNQMMQRPFKFAMGDSGSDLEVMQRLGKGIVVGEAIKDEDMSRVDHFRISAHHNDFQDSWNFLRLLRDNYKAKTRYPIRSRTVLRG